MKNILYMLMILAMSLSFVACGGSDDDDGGDGGDTWGTDINPIKGTWISESKLFKRTFTDGFVEIIYNWNKVMNEWDDGTEYPYKINKESFKNNRPPMLYFYRLEGNDVLFIRAENSQTWTKYNREK